MPKGVCRQEKAVLVTVYIERSPRRRRVSSNHNHNHHHHHPIKQTQSRRRGGGLGRGYNRKAELLHYSHCLRESARSVASTPFHPTPVAPKNQQPRTKTIAVCGKNRHPRIPTCFSNWKNLVPKFLRSSLGGSHGKDEQNKKKKKKHSGSVTTKIKAIMKSSQKQKKWGFVSKLFTMLQNQK